MFRARSIQSSLSIKDKILSIDYILVISIFILGLTSILAMFSTDGGELKYHTKSHILRFFVFFSARFSWWQGQGRRGRHDHDAASATRHSGVT